VLGLPKKRRHSVNDVFLHALPLHHVHGLVNGLISVHAAGAKIKMHSAFNASNVIDDLISKNHQKAKVSLKNFSKKI